MRRRTLLLALLAPACAPTPAQQAAVLGAGPSLEQRASQTRRFDTTDRALLLQSCLGALQDLGFTIGETQAQLGVVVATKAAGGQVRAQVVVRQAPDPRASTVRVSFQRVVFAPGAMLPRGEALDDPLLYQGFFEKVAQSAFLTAHEI